MEIGQRLKDKRTELSLSQEQLASQLGVTRQTIANWEKGKTYPDIGSILKLSELYDLSLDELLKEDTRMKKHVENTAAFTNKLWNSLFVTASLLLPASMLLNHWEWAAAASAVKLLGMLLLLLVLIFRWKLSGGKKSDLAIGILFWTFFAAPDLIGLFVPGYAVAGEFTFEYILFGILLLYSYGFCFQTQLAFILTIGIYFGTPIYIAAATHLPEALEQGITSSHAIFGKSYRVEEVLYQDDGANIPSLITLDSDGKTLILDRQCIGQFTKMPNDSGDPAQTWKLIPTNDPIGRVILSDLKPSGSSLTLEYRIDISTSEYSKTSTLWSVRLSPVEKFVFRLEQERSTSSLLMDWYSPQLVPESRELFGSATLETPGTAAIIIEDETVTALTVWEEYHCGNRIERQEYHVTRDKTGVFSLPTELRKRYDAAEQFVIYGIPWNGGEYLLRLNYS